jgi:hypothetical protein
MIRARLLARVIHELLAGAHANRIGAKRFGVRELAPAVAHCQLPVRPIGKKRRQAAALVRLQAHMVREVQVLFRHALSGL